MHIDDITAAKIILANDSIIMIIISIKSSWPHLAKVSCHSFMGPGVVTKNDQALDELPCNLGTLSVTPCYQRSQINTTAIPVFGNYSFVTVS